MILERLLLENFRQFKGRQELVFSNIRDRNVTVVHAENGFGKTTLLKALLWGLYGRDGLLGSDGKADDFEKPDLIIHEGLAHAASNPNDLSAKVQITFKHDNDRYILTRELTLAQQKLNPRNATVLLEVMRDGQTLKLDRPQQRVETIVPEGIRRFLFFNGERINYLAMEENSHQVTEAIQQMLGLKLLKTTIDDFRHQNVRGKLRNELKETTCEEKRELIENLSNFEADLVEKKNAYAQTHRNLEAIMAEFDLVEAKLAKNREAKELQDKRRRLTIEREEFAQKRTEVENHLKKLLADSGYALFTETLLRRGKDIVARLRSEGKIPAKVLNTFLYELLESGDCICKRSLEVGTPERTAVERLLTIAGDQDFNNAVGALDNAMGHIEAVAEKTKELLQELKLERLEVIRELRDRDEEIEEIHQVLGGKNDEEVQQLEESRMSLQIDRDSCNGDLGRIERDIETLKEQIEALGYQIREVEDKEDAAVRAQRRIDAVEDSIKILEDILEAEVQDLRPLLNDEIDSHFRKIMTKDYWVELTKDYTLRIRKKISAGTANSNVTAIDAALSTGERTVTSLVFIASLVALAQRRSEIPTILKDLGGAAYPVAIDSPFGSLSVFRRGVAKYIPELAPQVLLFVSPEQYNGQVEEALEESGRVGKRYYLTYHGPTIPENANPELLIAGEAVQQYFPTFNEEFTRIESI